MDSAISSKPFALNLGTVEAHMSAPLPPPQGLTLKFVARIFALRASGSGLESLFALFNVPRSPNSASSEASLLKKCVWTPPSSTASSLEL